MALSARGVPGEFGARAGLPSLVERHGGGVPNFTIFGHQKKNCMFKDKAGFANVFDKEEWVREPGDGGHATRSALKRFQKVEIVPDISYDLDGDGVVGQRDYFIGKSFDQDRDNKLNATERGNAVSALSQGWLDTFSFGHDQAGSKRPYPVVQLAGKVLTVDNAEELADLFPLHPDQSKTPNYPTKMGMKLGRRAEAANLASTFMENHYKRYPFFEPEKPVTQEHYVKDPMIHSVGERAEAEHQAARVKCGLLPTTTMMNPLREQQAPSMEYNENPSWGTRLNMRQGRKEANLQELEEQRLHGEQHYVPYSMRASQRDAAAFEFRRPDPDALTLSKLKSKRRAHRIEYEMSHNPDRGLEYPKFSEQNEAWYTLRKGYFPDASGERHVAHTRGYVGQSLEKAEVTSKVTATKVLLLSSADRGLRISGDTSKEEEEAPPHAPMPWQNQGGPHVDQGEISGRTMKKWSSEFSDNKGDGRHFDNATAAVTLSTDYMPLDYFSSFDVIRSTALKKEAERRKRTMGRASVLPYGVDRLAGGTSQHSIGGIEMSIDFDNLRGGLLNAGTSGHTGASKNDDRFSEHSSEVSEHDRPSQQHHSHTQSQGQAARERGSLGQQTGGKERGSVTTQSVASSGRHSGRAHDGHSGGLVVARQEGPMGEDVSMLERLTVPKLTLSGLAPMAPTGGLSQQSQQESMSGLSAQPSVGSDRRTAMNRGASRTFAVQPASVSSARNVPPPLPPSARDSGSGIAAAVPPGSQSARAGGAAPPAVQIRSSGFQWVDKVSPRPEVSVLGGSKGGDLGSDLGGGGSSLGRGGASPSSAGDKGVTGQKGHGQKGVSGK